MPNDNSFERGDDPDLIEDDVENRESQSDIDDDIESTLSQKSVKGKKGPKFPCGRCAKNVGTKGEAIKCRFSPSKGVSRPPLKKKVT